MGYETMIGHRYKRFVILSSPRSGTHMLRTSLNKHRNVESLAEMFNPDLIGDEAFDTLTPEKTILSEHIYRPYTSEISAVGFAIHRAGAPLGNWGGVWDLLEADQELHVILLHRHDLLRRYLSHCTMRERNRSGDKTLQPKPRRCEPEDLKGEFEQYEKTLASFKRRFGKHPLLQVSYEDLCARYAETLTRIQGFLGLPYQSVAPGTQRNPSIPPSHLLENFDELADAFARTRWAYFFRTLPGAGALSANRSATFSLELPKR